MSAVRRPEGTDVARAAGPAPDFLRRGALAYKQPPCSQGHAVIKNVADFLKTTMCLYGYAMHPITSVPATCYACVLETRAQLQCRLPHVQPCRLCRREGNRIDSHGCDR